MKDKKKKALTVAYEVGKSLYINITNRCSNRCDFCIRNNGDGAYGSDSLWLTREPTTDEILAAVLEKDPRKYEELVFCGYGEPSYRLEAVREVSLRIKEMFPEAKIRINTNGQSNLIHGCDTEYLYEGALDAVSISLNAPDAEKYQRICHSIYGEKSFDEILKFAKNVKNYVQKVQFSVVKDFLTEKELKESIALSDECGVEIRIRDYISKDDTSE